jgi:superfamily I DNA/RNA helicase
MKRRIKGAFDDEGIVEKITIANFHSFGMALLREFAPVFGRTRDFAVFGDDERDYVVSALLGTRDKDVRKVAEAIRRAKSRMQKGIALGEDLAVVYAEYEERLKKENAFDIDDLINYPARLIHERVEIGKALRERHQWLCVDEYQDINPAQYRLIRALAPNDESNIFAIGDPDQAIYGFRGSDNTLIQNFRDDYPSASIYALTTSYRCSNTILQASDQVIREPGRNAPLEGLEDGIAIQLQECATAKSEAEFVARTIEKLMGGVRFFSLDSGISDGDEASREISFSDFGVLFRFSKMAPDIVKAMNDHGIPCQLVGEEPFFRQEPISTVVDILRLAALPSSKLVRQRLD